MSPQLQELQIQGLQIRRKVMFVSFWFTHPKLQYYCTSKPVDNLHKNCKWNFFSSITFYLLNNIHYPLFKPTNPFSGPVAWVQTASDFAYHKLKHFSTIQHVRILSFPLINLQTDLRTHLAILPLTLSAFLTTSHYYSCCFYFCSRVYRCSAKKIIKRILL